MFWLLACTGVDEPDKATDSAPPADSPAPDSPADSTDSAADTEPPERALRFDGDPPKNVLVISIDTLRRDAVGRFDGGEQSPFLDSVLAAGVSLDDHRSCSNWTYASMLCALGGMDNLEGGFLPYGDTSTSGNPGDSLEAAPEDRRFLGHVLVDAGYTAGLVSSNTFVSRSTNLWPFGAEQRADYGWEAAEVVDEGLALQSEISEGGTPWLLHLHFIDPHTPYVPPLEYLGASDALEPIDYEVASFRGLREVEQVWDTLDADERALLQAHVWALYDGEIQGLDDELERLWSELDARGALEDTLVLVLSDHGEQFWEHGLSQHGNSLYLEENATIAGFWAKNLQPRSWAGPTRHRDLLPTLLDAVGVEEGGWTGHVLGLEADDEPRLALRFYEENTLSALQAGDWRLHYRWNDRNLELYDVADDAGETTDVSDSEPEKLAELWALHAVNVDRVQALHPDVKRVPSEAE